MDRPHGRGAHLLVAMGPRRAPRRRDHHRRATRLVQATAQTTATQAPTKAASQHADGSALRRGTDRRQLVPVLLRELINLALEGAGLTVELLAVRVRVRALDPPLRQPRQLR